MVINASISGTPSSLRKVHRMMALRNLLHDGNCSRKSLAKKLGISSMAMTRISGDLINAGLVLENGFIKNDNIPGPNQINLTINKNSVFGVGIVLSAFKTEIGIVGANGEIIESQNIELEDISDGMKALSILIQKIKELIKFKHIEYSRILGVGISVAADLDVSKKRILGAGYLGWKPFDIKKTVEDQLLLPTFIEKIPNALILSETSIGCAKKLNNILLLHSSTVLGASLIINNEVVDGAYSKSGRVGHFNTHKTELICSCGRNDCLNCVASGWSILVEAGMIEDKKYMPELVPVYAKLLNKILSNKEGHIVSEKLNKLFYSAGKTLALNLTKINQIIDPQIIILAGLLSKSTHYSSGIKDTLRSLGTDGISALSKLKLGNVYIIQATCFMPLLKTIFTPNFNFEELYHSSLLVEENIANKKVIA